LTIVSYLYVYISNAAAGPRKKVSDFYTQQFKFSPAKDKAVAYAKNRGINSDKIAFER
jgi:hypothetical protein